MAELKASLQVKEEKELEMSTEVTQWGCSIWNHDIRDWSRIGFDATFLWNIRVSVTAVASFVGTGLALHMSQAAQRCALGVSILPLRRVQHQWLWSDAVNKGAGRAAKQSEDVNFCVWALHKQLALTPDSKRQVGAQGGKEWITADGVVANHSPNLFLPHAWTSPKPSHCYYINLKRIQMSSGDAVRERMCSSSECWWVCTRNKVQSHNNNLDLDLDPWSAAPQNFCNWFPAAGNSSTGHSTCPQQNCHFPVSGNVAIFLTTTRRVWQCAWISEVILNFNTPIL